VERTSWAITPRIANVMRGNRSRDTKPELAVRRLLHARGLRYRVNARPVPTLRRTADVVFPRKRIAVFIDGCYWHGCPAHYVAARSNRDYWDAKIARNISRDAETTAALSEAGWKVLRYWSHTPPEQVAASICEEVRGTAAQQSRPSQRSAQAN
jgi:DNA mismatch endonuclease (patch repair protein)